MLRIVVALAFLVSCGPSAREVQLKATLTGLNTARDGFAAFSHAQANAIIDGCDVKTVTEAECTARLTAYRVKEAKVVLALAAAYSTLAVAVTLNDSQTIAAAIEALAYAMQAYNDLKGIK